MDDAWLGTLFPTTLQATLREYNMEIYMETSQTVWHQAGES